MHQVLYSLLCGVVDWKLFVHPFRGINTIISINSTTIKQEEQSKQRSFLYVRGGWDKNVNNTVLIWRSNGYVPYMIQSIRISEAISWTAAAVR